MTDNESEPASPGSQLWAALLLGALAQAVGLPMYVFADVEGLRLIGLVVAGFGAVLALIGSVGFGVLLGMRARDAERV